VASLAETDAAPDGGEEDASAGEEASVGDKKSSRGVKRGTEAGRLDEQLLPYVKEVTVLARANEFEADEDRELFVDNVWRELKMRKAEQLVRLITHKDGSAAVESLLPLSSPKQLYRVCRGLKGAMARVIFNPYGSHVLEALFGFVPRLVNASMEELTKKNDDEDDGEEGEEQEEDTSALESLEKMFQATCDELAGGWMEIMMDARGSHVLRAILRALSGLEPKDKPQPEAGDSAGGGKFGKGRQKQTHGEMRPANWKRHPVPRSFGERLGAISTELSAEENAAELSEMSLNSAAAPVLQMLLLAVRNKAELVEGIARALLRSTGERAVPDKAWVLKMAQDECGSHMMEALVEVLPGAQVDGLADAFRGSYVQLSRQRTANHVVQRLLERVQGPPQVRLVLQELSGHIAELLQWNRPGVVRSLADMLARTGEGQAEFVKAICKALNLSAPQDHTRLVPALLLLQHVPEDYAAVPGAVSGLIGSLLLQTLIKYEEEHMTPVLKSFAAISPEYLVRIACDNSGSRALEAFYASATMPLKAKTKVTERLVQFVAKVAADRCGSHVIENAYRAANVDKKKALVEALAKEYKTLQKTHFGAMVCKKCRVDQFVAGSENWQATEERAVKSRDLFAEIIADAPSKGGKHGAGADGKGKRGVEGKGKMVPEQGRKKAEEEEEEDEEEERKRKQRKQEKAAESKAKQICGSSLDDTVSALTGGKEKVEKKRRKGDSVADAKIEGIFASSGSKRKASG